MIPSFTAEASLYFPRGPYRGSTGEGSVARNAILPQDCSGDCALTYGLCLLGSGGNPIAVLGCYAAFVICELNCPSPGGNGGPPGCCPVGTSCRCGGTCQMVNGRLRCVDGMCLRPGQVCP